MMRDILPILLVIVANFLIHGLGFAFTTDLNDDRELDAWVASFWRWTYVILIVYGFTWVVLHFTR